MAVPERTCNLDHIAHDLRVETHVYVHITFSRLKTAHEVSDFASSILLRGLTQRLHGSWSKRRRWKIWLGAGFDLKFVEKGASLWLGARDWLARPLTWSTRWLGTGLRLWHPRVLARLLDLKLAIEWRGSWVGAHVFLTQILTLTSAIISAGLALSWLAKSVNIGTSLRLLRLHVLTWVLDLDIHKYWRESWP